MLFGRTGPTHRIALKSPINGLYLCAEQGSGWKLFANRPWHREWETYVLHELGNGEVALQSEGSGKWVCAEVNDGGHLVATRDNRGEWETFDLQENSGQQIALRAKANGKWVCAEMGGDASIRANRDNRAEWELFALDFVTEHSPMPSPSAGTTRKFVNAGDWQTLETTWNVKIKAFVKDPVGAEVRVIYGPHFLGITSDERRLDGNTHEINIGFGSVAVAELQMKVPFPTVVYYGWYGEGIAVSSPPIKF